MLGLGTWKMQDPSEMESCLETALTVGYRHIDTAQRYFNEEQIGSSLEKLYPRLGLRRQELFLTSKLDNHQHSRENVRLSCEESLRKLKTDYLDLFLIHFPLSFPYAVPLHETWRAMEELVRFFCVGCREA